MSTLMFNALTDINAQGTLTDYDKAKNLGKLVSDKILHSGVKPEWIGKTSTFWYSTLTEKGTEYYLVNAATAKKSAAFDAEKLAAQLATQTGKPVKSGELNLRALKFSDDLKTATFNNEGFEWIVDLKKKSLTKGKAVSMDRRGPWPPRNWSERRDELDNKPEVSPDSLWDAFIKDFNVWIKPHKGGPAVQYSKDGVPGFYYSSYHLYWSPDSKKLVAVKFRPAWKRMVHYIESSPADQVQPKHSEVEYAKPGDELPYQVPVLFLREEKKQFITTDELFSQQYDIDRFEWTKDSRMLTFEYNQRGHQVYRILGVDGTNGSVRTLIEETSPTFINYSGYRYRYDLKDGAEIIWSSERDGWNHLYRFDTKTGKVINQITKGEWMVRSVLSVDEEKQQITFEASGKESGQDPYFIQVYRINFDGTGLVRLTDGDGNHSVSFSPDKTFLVDTWSRVDLPSVSVLRKSSDGSVIMEIEKADITKLLATGWKAPEVFTAKGRDGKTDIWGVIIRPFNYDPNKKYPVIENIYAGPQGSFVPKTFSAQTGMQSYAELGFIVVQIDGMGTANRSKAFHDVCWRNLADAGFPDRILWMQAAAKKDPAMDISRVGIYGTSAGGQNSTGAVLFHPEFYKVAVSSCGCQDNRMDKIWWNEQWMGYPIGEWYEASSNVVNANKLKGKLLLIVGEMDHNVDPASTMQVVDALIKANKDFDLLVVPGMDHSTGGPIGDRKRMDFFVKHLLSVDPPDWNNLPAAK
ncbi:MAG: DPP IV N-terminal domain-containing protein [Bacteroidales bacterium]|nr:DPP IV N-terminal domain-containing protein [Bacteroidales bacterium]